MASAAGYLAVKKLSDFSLSGWLANKILHQHGVNLVVDVALWALVIAVLIKIVSLVFEYFPPKGQSSVDPDEISDCLMRMNDEIQTHLDKFDPANLDAIRGLNEQHAFDVNTRSVVVALADHIRRSVDNVSLRKRDTFISLYAMEPCGSKLKYLLHFDPRRDIVKSKVIDLSGKDHADYECVRCLNAGGSTSFVSKKSDYAVGDKKRHKTIKQYMGCKLCVGSSTYGFLNIEFHNHNVFTDSEEMEEFMLEHVIPFKLLLEYQFLKKKFFESMALI